LLAAVVAGVEGTGATTDGAVDETGPEPTTAPWFEALDWEVDGLEGGVAGDPGLDGGDVGVSSSGGRLVGVGGPSGGSSLTEDGGAPLATALPAPTRATGPASARQLVRRANLGIREMFIRCSP
jgi:hypothetical protein